MARRTISRSTHDQYAPLFEIGYRRGQFDGLPICYHKHGVSPFCLQQFRKLFVPLPDRPHTGRSRWHVMQLQCVACTRTFQSHPVPACDELKQLELMHNLLSTATLLSWETAALLPQRCINKPGYSQNSMRCLLAPMPSPEDLLLFVSRLDMGSGEKLSLHRGIQLHQVIEALGHSTPSAECIAVAWERTNNAYIMLETWQYCVPWGHNVGQIIEWRSDELYVRLFLKGCQYWMKGSPETILPIMREKMRPTMNFETYFQRWIAP